MSGEGCIMVHPPPFNTLALVCLAAAHGNPPPPCASFALCRDQAVAELKGSKAEDAEDKRKLLDILQRFHDQMQQDEQQQQQLMALPHQEQHLGGRGSEGAGGSSSEAEDDEEEDKDGEGGEEGEGEGGGLDDILSEETIGRILGKVKRARQGLGMKRWWPDRGGFLSSLRCCS